MTHNRITEQISQLLASGRGLFADDLPAGRLVCLEAAFDVARLDARSLQPVDHAVRYRAAAHTVDHHVLRERQGADPGVDLVRVLPHRPGNDFTRGGVVGLAPHVEYERGIRVQVRGRDGAR